MPDHRVFLELPSTELTKADASFKVKKNGKLLGTIHISHGAFAYQPTGREKRNSIKIDWAKFDKYIRDYENT